MPTGTRITKGTVDRIVADGRDRIYWDGDLEGFGLRVRPSGHKAYVVRFRAGGRTHRVTLGPHGVLTPEAARRRAVSDGAEVRIFDEVPRLIVVGGERWFAQPWRWW